MNRRRGFFTAFELLLVVAFELLFVVVWLAGMCGVAALLYWTIRALIKYVGA